MKSAADGKGASGSRGYSLGRRQVAADANRARIVHAAGQLLAGGAGAINFSMDAVARRAGVARMTVYHQFGSKRDLLEALFDDLAVRSLVQRLLPALAQADPRQSLAELIGAFAEFWTSERRAIRRIRAMAALDPDFERGLHERDERRRHSFRTVLTRLDRSEAGFHRFSLEEAVDLVWTMTSFESFDALAGANKSPNEVQSLIHDTVLVALGLNDEPVKKARRRK